MKIYVRASPIADLVSLPPSIKNQYGGGYKHSKVYLSNRFPARSPTGIYCNCYDRGYICISIWNGCTFVFSTVEMYNFSLHYVILQRDWNLKLNIFFDMRLYWTEIAHSIILNAPIAVNIFWKCNVIMWHLCRDLWIQFSRAFNHWCWKLIWKYNLLTGMNSI